MILNTPGPSKEEFNNLVSKVGNVPSGKTVQGEIDSLNNDIGLAKCKTTNVSFTYSVEANAYFNCALTEITSRLPSGAIFLGVVGWDTGSSYCVLTTVMNNGNYGIIIRNLGSSALSNVTLSVVVLYREL